jgi:hypothetical protein
VSADDGPLVDTTDDLLAFGNDGNGGIISTADEVLTILQAVVSGELLEGDLVADMVAGTAQSAGRYGLGLGHYDLTCGTFYGHEGSVNCTVSIAVVSEDGGGRHGCVQPSERRRSQVACAGRRSGLRRRRPLKERITGCARLV